MTTDELIASVAELGLALSVSPDGSPLLRGDRTAAIPELLRVLRLPCHRAEIVRRLKPPATRRVVALDEGPDGPAGEVLAEPAPGKESETLQRLMPLHPGRLLAAEWRQDTHAGPQWLRFIRAGGAA